MDQTESIYGWKIVKPWVEQLRIMGPRVSNCGSNKLDKIEQGRIMDHVESNRRSNRIDTIDEGRVTC